MSDLKIQVIVDGTQVTAGMSGVAANVEAATNRIKAAFGSVENAPAGIQNALLILQRSSLASAEAVAEATSAINELAVESETAGQGVKNLGNSAAGTALQMTRMDNAMAMATGRMAGFTVGAGMLGGALGRVGAASSSLGPILAGAFPVFAAIVFIDVLDKMLDKFDEWAQKEDKVSIAWNKLAIDLQTDLERSNKELQHLNEKWAEVVGGPLAGFRAKLDDIAIGFDTVRTASGRAFSEIDKDLKQADISRWNPMSWLNVLRDAPVGTKDLEPLANKIQLSLQEALLSGDQQQLFKAIDSGISQMVEKAHQVNATLVKTQEGDSSIPYYQQRLQAINGIIDALKTMRKLQENEGEIEKQKGKDLQAEAAKKAIELDKKREEQNKKVIASLIKERDEEEKLSQAIKKLANDEAELNAKSQGRDSEQGTKDLAERQAAEREFRQDRLTDEKQAALAEIALQEQQVAENFRLGKISAYQQAQQLNELEVQKLQIEKQYLQERANTILARLNTDDAKTYAEDLKEWSKLLSEKQKAEDTYQKSRLKNINAAATNEQKVWDKMMSGINRIFDQAIQGIVTGTETFGKAFGRIIDGMLAKFIQAMLQMVAQWVISHVFMVAVKQSAQQKEVLSDAKAAAAGAWKAVVGIPIIGPVLAPIAAATAFAGVEAFASAAGGWEVPRDTLAMVHQNEMILPANLSSGLKGLIAGGGSGGPQIHVEFSGNFNAIDSRGMRGALSAEGQHIGQIVMRELRRANAV